MPRADEGLVPFEPRGEPEWAAGKTFLVPEERTPDTAAALRERRAFTERPPTSSRLPFSYQLVPSRVRDVVARTMGRVLRRRSSSWGQFPRWPLDLSADLVLDLAGDRSPFEEGPTPVLLTHDLDSAEGLTNLVTRFLDLEERFGARSTSFVVPCGWPLDHGALAGVRERGHVLGIHGYDHANRTPFLPEAERRARLEAARPLRERYGIDGYRAPSLLRTRGLLRDLAAGFRWDASVPTSGGPFPVPNNGCASARPFRLEGIWELPLSLPRDGSLLFLGHAPEEIGELWCSLADEVARSGGVVVLLAHCEERFSGSPAMRGAYERFLEHVASNERFRFATPAEVIERAERGATA
jgi:peptidoglycan/xylan/chitin deacetylase (PgdA/CDA1 family)